MVESLSTARIPDGTPRLLTRRRWHGKHRAIRCALCYRHLWPWQQRTRGANYFPHPWMMVHLSCGLDYSRAAELAMLNPEIADLADYWKRAGEG